MSYSNRELVESFVSYKLSQRNYSASVVRPEDAGGGPGRHLSAKATSNGLLANSRLVSPPGGIEAVKAALQESADKFELLFAQSFSDLPSQIDITPDTAYRNFKTVMDEVFSESVNWGRIVGLFAFGGVMCLKCVEKGMSDLVPRIVDWMTTYLDEHISPWIQSHGGWVSSGPTAYGETTNTTTSKNTKQPSYTDFCHVLMNVKCGKSISPLLIPI